MSEHSAYAENLRRMVEALNSEISRAPWGVTVDIDIIDHQHIERRDPLPLLQVEVRQKI